MDLIVSSIVSALVSAVLTWLFIFAKKEIQEQKVINLLTKSGIDHVYVNQHKAEDEIFKYGNDSKKIYIFTSFGSTFTDIKSKMRPLLKKDDCDIKFLILKQDSQVIRDYEDGAANIPDAVEQLGASIATLKNLQKKNNSIEFLLHDELSSVRLYIFDEVLYLGFRSKEVIGPNLQMWRIKKDSYLYKIYSEQFDSLWKKYCKLSTDKKS